MLKKSGITDIADDIESQLIGFQIEEDLKVTAFCCYDYLISRSLSVMQLKENPNKSLGGKNIK
ncbi:MAG: hypothetical protein WBA74_01405 [Cyclobacteriaceae bacterium]